MQLPYSAPIESLAAGMVGLWVAIHTINPTTQQHEVHRSAFTLISLYGCHLRRFKTGGPTLSQFVFQHWELQHWGLLPPRTATTAVLGVGVGGGSSPPAVWIRSGVLHSENFLKF